MTTVSFGFSGWRAGTRSSPTLSAWRCLGWGSGTVGPSSVFRAVGARRRHRCKRRWNGALCAVASRRRNGIPGV